MIEVYTDGACHGSTGIGGIGIVLIKDNKLVYQYNKQFTNTTNNRMEITAIIYALYIACKFKDSIILYSDSQYAIGCITKNWNRKKNKDLWEKFNKVYQKTQTLCPNIKFEWVKGHSINKFNNLADTLAVEASNI